MVTPTVPVCKAKICSSSLLTWKPFKSKARCQQTKHRLPACSCPVKHFFALWICSKSGVSLKSIQIHYFHPFPSISIHFHLFPSISIHFHPFPSISIHFHPFPSISIHFHPFPSISIHFHPFPSISIYFHLFPSISIYFIYFHAEKPKICKHNLPHCMLIQMECPIFKHTLVLCCHHADHCPCPEAESAQVHDTIAWRHALATDLCDFPRSQNVNQIKSD